MSANKKVVLIVFLGACAGLLGFIISQYFSKRTHDDKILLLQVRSLASRIEHIRLLREDFVRYGDAVHWGAIVRDMDSLETELLPGFLADFQWGKDLQDLKAGLAAYRSVLDRIHDPALHLKAEKARLEELGRSFAEEVQTRIIEPYRKEEGLGMYQGRRMDPFKTRIKETAYDVMLLHFQQQRLLQELIADWDLSGYRHQKETVAQAMEKRKTQLYYLGVLMGGDASIGPVIVSLGNKMVDLVRFEEIVIGMFEALTRLNAELIQTGDQLLLAGENLTAKIVADISAANRLNRVLSRGLLVAILGGLGILGALLARDIIRFVKDIENSREALRASEERLGLALDGANEGIWDWYLESNILHFDTRYYTMAGYAPNAFPAAFEEWEKRVHPEDIRKTKAVIERYLSGDLEKFDVEFRFLRKDGSYMWIQGRGKIVARNEQGDPVRFTGTHADITQRKQIEESLRITQFSFNRAAVGIYRIASDASILEVNDKAARMIGYTKDELAAMSIVDIDPNVTEGNWGGIWQRLLVAGVDRFEAVHLTKDGRSMPVEIHSNLLDYGDQQYAIAFVQDITERKRSDEELHRLRNYLSNIIDSMPSVLVGVDRQGAVTQWNRRAEQVTGIRSEQARYQPLDKVFPSLIHEMDRIQASIRDRQVLRDSKVPRGDSDATCYEDVTIYPLTANGVEGAVIRVDDVTERVRLEEMMIQSEKMLSVGGLAAGMAHEINNPLAGILQNAAVLESRLTGDLPANHKAAEAAGTSMDAIRRYLAERKLFGMLENIRASGSLAASIVKNMLSFARKSDKVVSSKAIGALLDQSLDLLKTDYDMKKKYDFKQIEIVREYDDAAVPVPCEASKIQQVFMNILRNGAEAMTGMTDGQSSPAFVLRVQNDGDWVRVEIEDNGPGMDENTRRRIFEPFFTTKPAGHGTGLGLSVSYFIVTEDHGGEMSVQAAETGGTCFVIYLPKAGRKDA